MKPINAHHLTAVPTPTYSERVLVLEERIKVLEERCEFLMTQISEMLPEHGWHK